MDFLKRLKFPHVLMKFTCFFVSIKNNKRNAYEMVNFPAQKMQNHAKKGN